MPIKYIILVVGSMAAKDIKKRLEQFKKTQDINKILKEGNIESQALIESAGEDRPAEASHAYDLINRSGNVSLNESYISENERKIKRATKVKKSKKKRAR